MVCFEEGHEIAGCVHGKGLPTWQARRPSVAWTFLICVGQPQPEVGHHQGLPFRCRITRLSLSTDAPCCRPFLRQAKSASGLALHAVPPFFRTPGGGLPFWPLPTLRRFYWQSTSATAGLNLRRSSPLPTDPQVCSKSSWSK
jgi:hypothetical protein